jgi:hypothetical protein
VSRLELLLDEFERARANHLGDLRKRVGVGEALRHHEQRQARHLGEPVEQQRERLFELDRKPLIAVRLHLVEHRRHRLPVSVARHPALDRGDAIGAAHRAAVMKAEPVAQFELISELIRRDAVIADHLRMRREFGVDREQVVEHAIAVVAGDVGGGPDRIENAQVGLRDEAQCLPVVRGAGRPVRHRYGERSRRRRLAEIAAGQMILHGRPPETLVLIAAA